jgi:MoaA/NifB/PqqE/SkfB family radical SAM enzyme
MSKYFDPQSKVIANLDFVLAFLKGGNPPPVLVEVDPSNTCNHACPFCISSYIHLPESKGLKTYDKSILPEKTLLALCKDFKDMGVKAVNWTGGGEPQLTRT